MWLWIVKVFEVFLLWNYWNAVGKVMVDKVKDLLIKLYIFYSSIHSPNVQEPSESERTQTEGDASDPYMMVHSWYECFLEATQSIGCSNEVDKYLAENFDGKNDVNFEILGGGRTILAGIKCCPKWLRMCWLYPFPLLHLSQHLALEVHSWSILEFTLSSHGSKSCMCTKLYS